MSDPNHPVQVDQAADGQVVQTQVFAPTDIPATAPPATPPVAPKTGWDAMTWATVVNSVLTLAALVVALFMGVRSLRVAEDSLRATSESLRQSNLATIYALGLEVTKFQDEHPKLARFFDKALRKPITDQELWEEYKKLPEEEQTLVYLGCQRIADFSQIAFVQRDMLPADDWDTWWSYITDQYDESPIYRDFLSRRPTWYAFLEAIKSENRAEYYRGYQKG
jgi:hypothetical protein